MALHNMKRKREAYEDEIDKYLSDESDFYGSPRTKERYTKEADTFDPFTYWANRRPSLMEISRQNQQSSDTSTETKVEPYNPYEGDSCGRQLGETVAEFLSRLPPETTPLTYDTPWIYIANPFRKKPAQMLSNSVKAESRNVEGRNEEGAMAGESNWAEFMVKGGQLLDELTRMRFEIEKENPGKVKGTITRKLNPLKDELVKRMLALAVELGCTSGKWLIFCEVANVNAVWGMVARGTANGELGSAAKVAPDDGSTPRGSRLICVYNDNFTDMDTIKRVVMKLKDYGLIGQRGIYYKCCAYTYLSLNRDNEYGIKTSLYSSTEVLASGKGKKQVQPTLLYKQKKSEDDWKALEDANPWTL